MKPIGACIFVVYFLMIFASLVRFYVFVMPPGGSKMLAVDVSIVPYQWLGRSPSYHEVLTPVQLLPRLQNHHHHHHHHTQAATTTTPQTSLAMDQKEKKQVQSIIDQLKGHSLPDGGEIVGSINSSSSEFNATNNRPHIVRQYESSSTASERKSTRETPDRKGITFSLFSLEDLLQYFVCKLMDVSVCILLAIYLLRSKVPPPPRAPGKKKEPKKEEPKKADDKKGDSLYPYPYSYAQYPYPYPYRQPDPFPYQYPYPCDIRLEDLQQCFGLKRAEAAARLGVSVSTFKRACRKHGITEWRNRMGSSGSVLIPLDQHGERNTSTARETPSHNVQIGIEGVPVGQNQEASEFGRDFTEGSIPLNSENGLITGSSFGWASQVNDQSTLSTPFPNHDALGFPPPQITLMPSENRGASIDLRNSFASQAEPDRHISGFSNLTFAACSDQAAPSQHVGGQAMQSTDHNAFVFPQTQMVSPQEPFPDFTEGSIPLNTENGLIIGSSSGRACQVNDQSTLSTPYPNHDTLVFPPPQMTSLPSEIRGGSIDLMNSVASQAEPFSDRHISGFSNFATGSDQAAPSQHVGGQAMQSTDHNAFVFPQTQMVSPQEPFPVGHVFEFSNWRNKHTNSVKLKAFYGEAIYKFPFPLTSGIDDLKKEVSKRLNVEVDRFEVKYRDEHGDLISLPFDEDWMLYLSSSRGNDEIRVFVFDKDSELL